MGGAGSAIAVDPSGQATYGLIHNYRGDVIGLLNEAGDIVEQYSYDLHGMLNVRACVPSSASASAGVATPRDCNSTGAPPLPGDHASQYGNTLLYAGNHRDPVTGQYRMGARWYSPTLRMFLSRDPAGYAFSFDEWAYTVGDPWNFVDRTGWGPKPELNEATSDSDIWPSLTVGTCGTADEDCLSVTLYFPSHRKQRVARLVSGVGPNGDNVESVVEYLIEIFGGAVNNVSGSISVFLVPNDEDEESWVPQFDATVQNAHPQLSDDERNQFILFSTGGLLGGVVGGTQPIGPHGAGFESIIFAQLAPVNSFGPDAADRQLINVLGTIVHEVSHAIFNANGVYSSDAPYFGDDALHSLVYSIAENWAENVSGVEMNTRFDAFERGVPQGRMLDSAIGRLVNVRLPEQRWGILRREVDNALNSVE